MKKLFIIIGLLFAPLAYAGTVTLTGDVNLDFLLVETGAILQTDGWDISVGGGTGATALHGRLIANQVNNDSTLFTQISNGFQTHGSGGVAFSGTGKLLLTGTGSDRGDPNTLTVSGTLMDLEVNAGLVGYWKMDDGEGTFVKDSSGNGNDGIMQDAAQAGTGWIALSPFFATGATAWTGRGLNPYSLEFDGEDDMVIVASDSSLSNLQRMTAAAWVKFRDSAAPASQYAMEKTTSFIFYSGGSTPLRLTIWDSGGSQIPDPCQMPEGITINNDIWYHIAAAADNNVGIGFYVDGVLMDFEYCTWDMTNENSNDLRLGGGGFHNGLLDDLRLYNYALTGSQIMKLANGFLGSGSGTYALGSALNVDGDFEVHTGGIDVGTTGYGMTVSGSYIVAGGEFHAGTGTVTLDATSHTRGAAQGSEYPILENTDAFTNLSFDNGLIGHWKLDEGTGTDVFDSSGNGNHGVMGDAAQVGTGWIVPTHAAKFYNPYGLDFDGVNDHLNLGNDSSLVPDDDFSLSAWTKIEGQEVLYALIFKGGYNVPGYQLFYNGGRLKISIGDDNGQHGSSTDLRDNTWHHVGVSFDFNSAKLTFFVDGIQTSTATSLTKALNTNTDFIIGRSAAGGSSQFFNGQIDEVRMYNRTLQLSEFSALAGGNLSTGSGMYTLASPLNIDGDMIVINDLNNASGHTISVSGSWLNTVGTYTAGTSTVRMDGIPANADNKEIKSASQLYDLEIDNGLVGYWKMDEGNGTIVRDSSRFGNHGVMGDVTQAGTGWILNTTPAGNAGATFFNPYSLQFNGNGDHIAVGNKSTFDFGTSSFSAVGWLKVKNNEVLTKRIIWKDASSVGYRVYLDTSGSISVLPRDGVNSLDLRGANDKDDDVWHHFVYVHDAGDTAYIYTDGVLDNSGSLSAVGDLDNADSFTIGAQSNGFVGPNGLLDDIRMYNRALSASEAAYLAAGNPSTGSGVYTQGTPLSLAGSMEIYAGTLVSSGSIRVDKNWINHGEFLHDGAGTVTLEGASNQSMSGNTVFWNLSATGSTTITMDHAARQSISGALVLQNITLRSSQTGSQATLTLDGSAGTQDVKNVDVQDNDASGGNKILCTSGCTDAGNTLNWFFARLNDFFFYFF